MEWVSRIAEIGVQGDKMAHTEIIVYPDGSCLNINEDTAAKVVLSGSFNPLHIGHWHLLEAASKYSKRRGYFEISSINADKGVVAHDYLIKRIEAVMRYAPVVVTSAALFVDKARALPSARFVMGIDTLKRIWDQSYYTDNTALDGVIDTLKRFDCTIIVAGRLDSANRFRTLNDIAIPKAALDLIEELPEQLFREDISSSMIRDEEV